MNASKNRRGFALIFALFLVVLVAATLVGFLLSVTTERSAAGGFASAADARQFSDTAVGLVQAQINQATTRGSNVAWVSQPGMVRTFDSTGNLQNAYKLYSAANMIDTTVDLTTDLPPTDWNTKTAQWVDLNAPASLNKDASGQPVKVFPILDPAALGTIGSIGGLGPNTAQGQVKGLAITSAPGATTYQPAPMPVRWLYMLKDGTVCAPSGGTSKTATITQETAANPVVGRVAFWTDDDTCKVNVNTAGEDTFWDVPHGVDKTETVGGTTVAPGGGYAMSQPVHGEYQRYPGHPATVSLSAVLPGLTLQNYMDLSPRYQYGGSKGGTVIIPPNTTTLPSIPPKGNRLYTAVDELLFNLPMTSGARTTNTGMTEAVVESRRFFLTPHSRAPETNLYNLPRIASWPIYKLTSGALDQTHTNPFDRTIALCSSTGTANTTSMLPYFFQREKSLDPDNDLVGAGSVGARNTQLYTYLQTLTNQPTPGFGGTFAAKYPRDRDQILTEMFDYVRCTNLYDDTLGPPPHLGYQFTADWSTYKSDNPGYGFVAPIHGPNTTQGQGRWDTIRQMNIMFIACADPGVALSNDPTTNRMLSSAPFPAGNGPFTSGTALNSNQLRIQAMVFPELYSTMVGWRSLHQDMRIEIQGLDKFKVNDIVPLGFPATAYTEHTASTRSISSQSASWGGTQGYEGVFYKKITNASNYPISASSPTIYPFVSAPVTIAKGSTFYLNAPTTPVTVRLYANASSGSPVLVQTLTINFGSGDIPVPLMTSNANYWTFFSDGVGTIGGTATVGRLQVQDAGHAPINNQLISPESPTRDVLRAMVLRHGDYRLIAGSQAVIKDPVTNTEPFVRHGWYNDTTKMQARLGADGGAKLIPVLKYVNGDFPSTIIPLSTGTVATAITSTPTATGDFDTGVANTADGAGVNKPDEGDFVRVSADSGHFPAADGNSVPYYSFNYDDQVPGSSFFSPNRIMPSPLMFGSLPTGVKSGTPWQTLLFRPLSTSEATHLGAVAPKDHLLADLFWMPLVEPYAMSDRFSTAGKVNMNYQILPFTYLERSAGMRAVLKNEMVTAILNNSNIRLSTYSNPPSTLPADEYRYPLDVDNTLQQFTDRFNQANKANNVFISPSELCNLYMVPKGAIAGTAAPNTVPNLMASWWESYRQTGDNLRERIYTTTYPKLTTKSNTYTVHYRAQSLKKAPNSTAGTWTEGHDAVLGEYRGSTTLERFINPDAVIPDYAANASTLATLPTLDTFYKWRVLESQQFTP